MELYDDQKAALAALLESIEAGNPLLTLSGAAGTGKTTMIKALAEALGGEAIVCTPTNKAAQVLCSKGIPAMTFFKRFYILEPKSKGIRKPYFKSCRRTLEQTYGEDWHAYRNRLPDGKTAWVKYLIVDEASMVGSRRLLEMQSMCDHLILIGDKNQLPPVGDDEYPAGVFNTLEVTAELTTVRRQDAGSLILTLADAIRKNDPEVKQLLQEFEPEGSFKELIQAGAQCLAFTNAERRRINFVARKIFGIRDPYPRRHDRMVVTNNYSEDLINGTLVTVVDFRGSGSYLAEISLELPNGRIIDTVFDMRSFIADQISIYREQLEQELAFPDAEDGAEEHLELTWAHCLTCHKAQGSEWDTVIVFDQRQIVATVQRKNPRAGLSPEEYVRRWLYTGITRAKTTLVFAPTWFAKSY